MKTIKNLIKVAVTFICCVSIVLCLPLSANATITRGTMSVKVDSSASVKQGESVSINCELNPASEWQLPCCSTDYCPSGCEAGGFSGCLDYNGFCTCLGGSYYTAYATCSVSSSAPNVARASYHNGILTIRGYAVGTATLRVSAKLTLWVTKTENVKVTVTESDSNKNIDAGGSGTSGNGSGSGIKGGSSAGKSKSGVGVSHVASGKKSTTSSSKTVESSSKIKADSTNNTNNKNSSGKKSDVKSTVEENSEHAATVVTTVDEQKQEDQKSTFIIAIVIAALIIIAAGAYVRYRIYKKQHESLNEEELEASTAVGGGAAENGDGAKGDGDAE